MSDPLSAADIAEGRRLSAFATATPWVATPPAGPFPTDYWSIGTAEDGLLERFTSAGLPQDRADAELIVWARNHLPALLDAAEKMANPPGYVVGWEGVDGPELYSGHEEIVHDPEAALGQLSRMREEEPVMDFQLYAVHRVVPGE